MAQHMPISTRLLDLQQWNSVHKPQTLPFLSKTQMWYQKDSEDGIKSTKTIVPLLGSLTT